MSLADLQQLLRAGEAYYKMTVVGDNVYALIATPQSARAVKFPSAPSSWKKKSMHCGKRFRPSKTASESLIAFDVDLARRLYTQLFQPFDAEIGTSGT